jgi:hypothetical protein
MRWLSRRSSRAGFFDHLLSMTVVSTNAAMSPGSVMVVGNASRISR